MVRPSMYQTGYYSPDKRARVTELVMEQAEALCREAG